MLYIGIFANECGTLKMEITVILIANFLSPTATVFEAIFIKTATTVWLIL